MIMKIGYKSIALPLSYIGFSNTSIFLTLITGPNRNDNEDWV